MSIVFLAALFGFLMAWGIGANDVSNAMGTSVGSKSITIKQAVVIAAIFEFLGSFLAGSEVTNTIRQDIIDISLFDSIPNILILGMLASLLSAATWLLLASFFGWPVSTTHTIVGAIIGFGSVELGISAIKWEKVSQIILGWIASPLLGGILSFLLFMSAQRFIFNKENPILAAKKVVPFYIFMCCFIIAMITFKKIHLLGFEALNSKECLVFSIVFSAVATLIGKMYIDRLELNPDSDKKFHYTNVEKIFSVLMIFIACAMAFAHGSNDVANAIGPVASIVSLSDPSLVGDGVPVWVLLLGSVGIVIGLATFGYKVIETVGNNITELTPSRGFSATLAAAATVVFASSSGLPISTTHTLVGGILGVGLARGMHALNLNVIRNIFSSWLITLPAGAILSILYFKIFSLIF